MKKIIKLLLVLFTLNSCISLHNGQFHNSTILTEANFKYKKQNAFGTSSTFNFLGLITDIDTKSLIGQAKADLYNYYKIEDYQTISNVTVNFKTTFFLFGVFSKTDCVFSADIIEFNRDFEKEIEIIENNEEDYDKNNNFVIKHDTLIIKEMNQNTLVNMNTDSLQIAPKIEQLVVKKSLGDYTVDNKVSFYTDIVIGGEKRKRYIKEAIVTDILNDTLIITDRTRNHNIVYKFQISEFKSEIVKNPKAFYKVGDTVSLTIKVDIDGKKQDVQINDAKIISINGELIKIEFEYNGTKRGGTMHYMDVKFN